MLGNARSDPSPHRQADVVACFRVHLIHERLVVQEVDLYRPSRLDRLRTWSQFETLNLRRLIRQRAVRLYDNCQSPAPPRDLVDVSPEVADSIRVVVRPSRPPRDVANAQTGFSPE